jgi:hypothetical protein
MEDTSDAANMTCHGTDNEKSGDATSEPSVSATRWHSTPGFAVAYERAAAGATRETFYCWESGSTSSEVRRKKNLEKTDELTFPAAASVAMRLALRRANLCMERRNGWGGEKEDCRYFGFGEGWQVELLPTPISKVCSEFQRASDDTGSLPYHFPQRAVLADLFLKKRTANETWPLWLGLRGHGRVVRDILHPVNRSPRLILV